MNSSLNFSPNPSTQDENDDNNDILDHGLEFLKTEHNKSIPIADTYND